MHDSSVGSGPVDAVEVVVGECGAARDPTASRPLVEGPGKEVVAVDHRPALQ